MLCTTYSIAYFSRNSVVNSKKSKLKIILKFNQCLEAIPVYFPAKRKISLKKKKKALFSGESVRTLQLKEGIDLEHKLPATNTCFPLPQKFFKSLNLVFFY